MEAAWPVPRRLRLLRTAATFATLLATLVLPPVAAHAQALKCTGFLHAADGSWRSFESGTVIGARGPVPIEAGETFRAADERDKGDIARILDHLCGD